MNNKRSTLKKISGVTVAVWAAPVVGCLVLPVHAQATVAPITTPLPEERGEPLLHFSSVTPNPTGDDCGPNTREFVAVTNSGTAEISVDGFTIARVLLLSGTETITTLSGVINAGETLSIDVCDGVVAGSSAVLNNQNGGILQLLDANADVVDIVSYPSILNGPNEGTAVPYGPTPSTATPRAS